MCFDYCRCDRRLLYAAYKDWTGMGGTKFPLKRKAFGWRRRTRWRRRRDSFGVRLSDMPERTTLCRVKSNCPAHEKVWRSSANSRFISESLHREISCIRQGNDRDDDIKDRTKSRGGHFASEAELFAFSASSTSLRTPSGVRSFGPISRLSTKSVGAVVTPSDLARA